jgi:hypothetical protein
MTTLLAYPDALYTNSQDLGTWTRTSATPDTDPGAVNEPGDDTEYIALTTIVGGAVVNGFKIWQFDLSSLPAGATINRCRINWSTWRNSWGEFRVRLGATNTDTGDVHYGPDETWQRPHPLSTQFDYSTTWRTADAAGTTWDAHVANSEELLAVVDHRYNDSDSRIYYLELEVEYSADPTVVTTTSPATTLNTGSVTVEWAYTGGNPQAQWHAKIFDDATYGGGGFDADTSTATWDSGLTAGVSTRAALVDIVLPNSDIYKAYVKAIDNKGIASAWDDSPTLTVAYTTPPTAPTAVSGSFSATTGNITVTITGSAGDYRELERSDDNGTTWVSVQAQNTSGSYVDGGAPLNSTTVKYRARSVTASTLVASAWETSTAVSTTASVYFLKAPEDGSLSISPTVIEVQPRSKRFSIRVGNVSGGNPTVVTSGDQGEEIDVVFRTDGATAWAALQALLDSGLTLLFQSPMGDSWYVRVLGDYRRDLLKAAPAPGETLPIRHLHEVSVTFVEVDYG